MLSASGFVGSALDRHGGNTLQTPGLSVLAEPEEELFLAPDDSGEAVHHQRNYLAQSLRHSDLRDRAARDLNLALRDTESPSALLAGLCLEGEEGLQIAEGEEERGTSLPSHIPVSSLDRGLLSYYMRQPGAEDDFSIPVMPSLIGDDYEDHDGTVSTSSLRWHCA